MKSSNKPLIEWAEALEAYARDWDATFGKKSQYFTQEYWYLLVVCVRAYWEGHELSMSQMMSEMLTGSPRTREKRIQRAISDGYLITKRSQTDRRLIIVEPSPHLEELVKGHLERTLEIVREKLTHLQPPLATPEEGNPEK